MAHPFVPTVHVQRGPSDLPSLPKGSSQTFLHCAHRTSTVLSCAFREQEGWSGRSPSRHSEAARSASTLLPMIHPSLLVFLFQSSGLAWSFTAQFSSFILSAIFPE